MPNSRSIIEDIREQVLYMQELGVKYMDVELPSPEAPKTVAVADEDKRRVKPPAVEIPNMRAEPARPRSRHENSRLSRLPSLAKRSVQPSPQVGILDAKSQVSAAVASSTATEAELSAAAPAEVAGTESIADIRLDIGDCMRCPLCAARTQVVHTTGNFNADLMFIGEAPGADEDVKGEPFVGRAGQLLTRIIEGIGYRREDVAIGNINRCRPPGNRPPTLPEATTCKPFLLREIAVIRPKVIVVMGNTALHNLLEIKVGITKCRGEFQDYYGVKVMPTFHPAYLLRDPNKKREVWEDMKKVRDLLKNEQA
ncbi:MAG: uracil-DNA glycosylase [Acidobacteriota bacterium]